MLSFVLALNITLSGNCNSPNISSEANFLYKENIYQSMAASESNYKPQKSDSKVNVDVLNKFITEGPINFRIPKDWSIEEYSNSLELKKGSDSIALVVYGPYNPNIPYEAYVGKYLQKIERSAIKCPGFKKAYKVEALLVPSPSSEGTKTLSFTHFLFIDKEEKNYILFSCISDSPYEKTFEKVSRGVERNEEYYSVEKDFGNADIN